MNAFNRIQACETIPMTNLKHGDYRLIRLNEVSVNILYGKEEIEVDLPGKYGKTLTKTDIETINKNPNLVLRWYGIDPITRVYDIKLVEKINGLTKHYF